MRKALILVEGQTEESFVKKVLGPYLAARNVYCIPKIATTKLVKSGRDFKGGITSYGKVKNDIFRLLKDTSTHIVTTMIDYYGFNGLVPYKNKIKGRNCFEKASSLEQLFKSDVNNRKFLPYLQVHEFEAMVFVSPEEIANALNEPNKTAEVAKIRRQFKSPEEINDNPRTAPPKRLERIFPSYQKTIHSTLITSRIGLGSIRRECRHFNDWVEMLERC